MESEWYVLWVNIPEPRGSVEVKLGSWRPRPVQMFGDVLVASFTHDVGVVRLRKSQREANSIESRHPNESNSPGGHNDTALVARPYRYDRL